MAETSWKPAMEIDKCHDSVTFNHVDFSITLTNYKTSFLNTSNATPMTLPGVSKVFKMFPNLFI